MYTRTFLPSRMTLLSFIRSMPSALARSTVGAKNGSLRSQIFLVLIWSRRARMQSWGSAKVGPSWSSFISSPEMSISWSFSGCSGPVGRKRSLENLLSTMIHLPSASLVSVSEAWLWPGWYWTSSFWRM
ncbi:hypothetical protein D3C81_1664710 [compost metagenome]